ncbi:cell division protein FtsL [Rummeliibacillus sp. NPDC094406]|uniref:cell division protein FtsL n=1 Tax=Rummeliibacillus sp. NPDC094406 TaxID=3364511 RepID=UPI0038047087
MALLDQKEHHIYIQQPVAPEGLVPKPAKKPFKSIITKTEKVLMIAMVAAIAVIAVMNLNIQSSINSTSVEIQKTEMSIDEVKKQNSELSMEVSELSTYDRIWKKAKALGLKLNENNVKVVSGQ